MMKMSLLAFALLMATASAKPRTFALFGDFPYLDTSKPGYWILPCVDASLCPGDSVLMGVNAPLIVPAGSRLVTQFDISESFMDAINDADVDYAVHTGDIHSGQQPCTKEYDQAVFNSWTYLKVPLFYTPGDNEWSDCQKIKKGGAVFINETGNWSLGTATGGELGGSQPYDSVLGYTPDMVLTNLNWVREIFFRKKKTTIGASLAVDSQAVFFDKKAHPGDAAFVENIIKVIGNTVLVTINVTDGSNNAQNIFLPCGRWASNPVLEPSASDPDPFGSDLSDPDPSDPVPDPFLTLSLSMPFQVIGNTVLVTINVPGGSNNNQDIWFKAPTMSEAQQNEVDSRTGAVMRWLDRAFAVATLSYADSVIIVVQADMWDSEAFPNDHLSGYTAFRMKIAALTVSFGKPVLLVNGDSHEYTIDNPFKRFGANFTTDATTVASTVPVLPIDNFCRIIVHGSALPINFLKMTVGPDTGDYACNADSSSFGPFKWETVAPSLTKLMSKVVPAVQVPVV
eukprot:gene19141-25749_t